MRSFGGTLVTETEYREIVGLPAAPIRRQSFVSDGTFYAVMSTPVSAVSWDWQYKS